MFGARPIPVKANINLYCRCPTGSSPEGQFALRMAHIVLRCPDYIMRRQSVHFHCLNDRAINNLPPVGASIARPLRTDARPVRLEVILFAPAFCFLSLRILTGGRPMAAPTGAWINNRPVIQTMVMSRLPPQNMIGLTQYRHALS